MRHRLISFAVGTALILLAPLAGYAADRVALVEDGKARAVLVLPPQPSASESLAAKEIASHLKTMSGTQLATINAPDKAAARAQATKDAAAPPVPIFIGEAFLETDQRDLLKKSNVEGSLLLNVSPDGVCVAGLGEGTAFAASELLEQLGVRWFMPGKLGTVIPETKTVTLAIQKTVQVPSFPARHFQMGQLEWQARLRCGGKQFPGAHGLPLPPNLFKEHPECFALVKGQRQPNQQCVSNPEVLRLTTEAVRDYFRKNPKERVIGLGPNDGAGFCECEKCRAMDGGDYDAFSGEGSVTDRYVTFFNQVLKGIESEFPDKKIGFYIYHTYMRPPVRVKPDPRITGALAPIALCRVHGPNNPVCPEAGYGLWLAQQWGKLIPELWDRGYWSNLACPGFPFIMVHRLREQIPSELKAGVTGWRVETFEHWGTELPSHYIAAKLMWNASADVEALLDDFSEKYYGPAAKPMRQYVTLMDAALRDADFHTGCSWNMPQFYPESLRKEARKLLKQAAGKAGRDNLYAERVQATAETMDFLEGFIQMLEACSRGELTAAKEALNRTDAARKLLIAHDPPMVAPNLSDIYMKRFYRDCIEEGAERVSGGNRSLAVLKDEWDFLLDPLRVGEDLGYWRADLRGGNWQKIRTCSASWSDQGLRYYKGLAWYRQTVKLPENCRDKTVFLWCGGVDEKAKVWVNGKLAGISNDSTFQPFEFDVTDKILPGAENSIAICIANLTVDELGTGGLVSPVLLYLPAAGKDAKPQNKAKLSPAFP
jgi:hypothetical protein